MSLVVTVYVPEGIVMASDSRQSLTIEGKTTEGQDFKVETISSDFVTKTRFLEEKQVGVSHYGDDLLDGIPIASYINRFINEELVTNDDVTTISDKLLEYFRNKFPKANAGFHVAGYKKEGKINVPHCYHCHVSHNLIERRNIDSNKEIVYGATWSGEIDVITSIISPVTIKESGGREKTVRGTVPIYWGVMTVQDAIDFAIYAIRTTIDTMRFQARRKTVGGFIDVLLMTSDNKQRWIQKKDFIGEHGSLQLG